MAVQSNYSCYQHSPEHPAPDLPTQNLAALTFEAKVDLFRASVYGWIFQPSWELADPDSPIYNGIFSALVIVMTYPEMVAQFKAGKSSHNASKRAFVQCLGEALKVTTTDGMPVSKQEHDSSFEMLYSVVRCGLFHAGRPSKGVVINLEDYGASIQRLPALSGEPEQYIVRVRRLIVGFRQHFDRYIGELKSAASGSTVATNFEKHFDNTWAAGPTVVDAKWRGLSKAGSVAQA